MTQITGIASPTRVRGIRPVGNDVPKEIRGILGDLREAVTQLGGANGAVLYGQFLDLLKQNIRQVSIPTSGGSDGGGSVNTDPYFQALKKQTEQALLDLAAMLAWTRDSELLVRENAEYIATVAADASELAADLEEQADQLAQQALDLIDLATDLDAIQVVLDDPSTGLLATSTLLDATVTRVDANETSIDVITAAITSLQSELIDTTALDPGIMWQFEGSDDDWTSNATLTTNTAYVSVGAVASSHIDSPSGIAIDGALFPRVVARIRRTAGTGWLGRVTYVTTGTGAHGFDSTNYHLTLASEPVFAGGGWVIVTWDMEILTAGGDDWVTHVIDQIRLELPDDNTTTFDVDWIALARVAPSYVTSTVNALESRVTQTENDIDALSASITTLTSDVSDLEGDVSGNTTAISTLSTRVTTAENDINVNSADIVSLKSRMDDAEDDISAQSSAISGLDSSVSSINGTLTAHAGDITSLDSRLDLLEPDVSGHASAISSLQADVTSIEGTLTSHSSALTSLDGRLDDAEADLSAQSSAISALDTRLDSAEGTISSHSTSLTSLNSRITSAEGVNSAQATAINNLDTRVTSNESGLSAQATAVTMLQVYGRDGNRLNPLTTPGNATDWTFANSDVVSISIGGRSTVAARRRTAANMMDRSKFLEIDPRGIYEVRVSVLKNLVHGSLYVGMYSSTNGVDNTGGGLPVSNRAITGGENTNPYWTSSAAGFAANTWYDFVFYILGSEADPALCPDARVNDNALPSSGWPAHADGFRLPAGARFALIRLLNYYNTVQTDAYWNNVSIIRLDNQRTAALTEEASIRLNADGLLNAQWTLKLDANGYVSGFGLAVVGGANGAVSSSFNVLADRFNVAMPGVSGPKQVFTIGNINGTPTVGINGNLIVDGTVITRSLLDASVTTPKIPNGAISTTVFSQGASNDFYFTGGADVLIAAVPINVSTGNAVRVEWYAAIYHNTNVNPAGIQLRLERGTTPLQTEGVTASEVTHWTGRIIRGYSHIYMDVPGPGTHTYNLRVSSGSGSGQWQVGIWGLAVTEILR